ncbi:unnamed protein product [Peniophora sp. CBMAI 1063]|nr:unnamed protein product [Peniophora sp. CBMAI 1063]
MESLFPTPILHDFDNWNFDIFAGNDIVNDDSWLWSDTGLITDGALLAGMDPVLAPAPTQDVPMPETRLDDTLPSSEEFLAALCAAAAVPENGGIDPLALTNGRQVQVHPQPVTMTHVAPTTRTDIPLVENRRVSIPKLNHLPAPTAPARRRSRTGSIAALNRQAQWSGQPKSPHDATFGRRASITYTHSRKRKHSICDVPLRRTAAPRAGPSRRPQPQVAHHAAYHPQPPPPVLPTPDLIYPRLSLSCDLLNLDLPPPALPLELPVVPLTLPEKFEDLPVAAQKAMISKYKTPPAVTCGWAGCQARIVPTRPSLRDHLNRCHGGRPTPPRAADNDGAANELRIKCEWGACSQWVQWGGMSRHLLSHVCPSSGHCMLCGGSLGRADMVERHIKSCWKRLGTERVGMKLRELGMLEKVLKAPVKGDGEERPKKRAKKA